MIIRNADDVFSLKLGRLIVKTTFGNMEVGFSTDEVRRTTAIVLANGKDNDFAYQAEVVAAGLIAEGKEARALPSD